MLVGEAGGARAAERGSVEPQGGSEEVRPRRRGGRVSVVRKTEAPLESVLGGSVGTASPAPDTELRSLTFTSGQKIPNISFSKETKTTCQKY